MFDNENSCDDVQPSPRAHEQDVSDATVADLGRILLIQQNEVIPSILKRLETLEICLCIAVGVCFITTHLM